MNELEYILRILLKARDETAAAFKTAREELRHFVNAVDSSTAKLDKFNASMATMERNMNNVTSKIKEWRAVIQGLSDDNDDSAKSIAKIGKETDTYIKTQSRAVQKQKEVYESASRLRQAYTELEKKVKSGKLSNDDAIDGYKRLGQELETVSKKLNVTTRDWERVRGWARISRESAQEIIDSQKRAADAAQAQAKRQVKIAQDLANEQNAIRKRVTKQREDAEKAELAAIKKQADEEKRIRDQALSDQQAAARREIAANERALAQKAAADARVREKAAQDRRNDLRERLQFAIDVDKTQERDRNIQEQLASRRRGGAVDPHVISDLRHLSSEYRTLSRFTKQSGEDQDRFRHQADDAASAVRRLEGESRRSGSAFERLAQAFHNNRRSIAGFDNSLRSLGILLVAGFAQQLITVLGGLAGQFVAVAASAVQAGAAIGGIFVAGVMQAIPVVGLLGAAFAQVKNVIQAVKQAQLERQQQSVQDQGADRRTADAADAIANAQRRLQEAQENLTKAREKARQDLEDLIATENEAKLAAVGAALSQAEAQKQLVAAQARGDVEGIQRAQLGVLQAQADAEDKLRDKTRARKEAERGRAGGVEGMEGVVQAKQQVADANRGLESAKRNAAEAAQGTQSAAQKLNFLLAQMTKGQRDLFYALEDLSKVYKRVFGPITDIILNSFTRATKRITALIQMPEMVSGARKLATEISKQLNRIFDSFTSDKAVAQFLRIANEARRNLKPITDILINLGHSFANIGEAGGPAFRRLISFVGDLADKFLKITENRKGLTDFFLEGEKHFEAWVKLGLSVIRLFLALSGAGGAESGLRSVEDATKAIDGLTKKIDDNREKVGKFFEDARKVTYEVVGVIVTLAEELFKAFKPDRVKNFADLLNDVVIPALGNAIDFMGQLTNLLLEFANTKFGGDILKGIVALLIVGKIGMTVFSPFFKVMEKLVGILPKLIPGLEGVGAAIESMGAATILATVGWAILVAAIIAGIIILLDKLGLLDDAWDAIKDGFNAFWKEVEPSIGKLVDAFDNLWDSLSKGEGAFALLRPVLKLIIDLGGEILKVFGRTMGRQLGGIIDMIAGVINLVVDLLSGRWSDAWDDAKDIVRGFVRAITAPFRALPELLWALLRRVIRRAASALGDMAESFGRWGRRAVNNFMEFIRDLPGRIGRLLTSLPDRLKTIASTLITAIGNMGKDAFNAFVKPWKDLGKSLIGVITSIFRGDFKGAAGDLAKAIAKLLNEIIPDKIGPIPLPDNPIKLAAGGAIPGYGGGDRVRALLEAGEHVLSKEEVAAAGGHLAIFALRRALGGGGQGSGGRFQPGGAVAGAGSLTIGFHGGDLDDFASQWREFWTALVTTARRGANAVEDQFRDMRVNTARNADLMYRRIRGSIADIQHSFDARGNRITSNWAGTWDSLTQTAYDGLFYIAHETNRALHGLEEKTVNFGLSPPKKAEGHQRGGMIPGYGDGDRVPVLAEPGEGFINKRAVRALGGPAVIDAINKMVPRFQGGGMVPIPGQPGETINPSILGDVVKLIRQYKLKVYDGFGGSPPHAPNSDHKWGGAIDVGPGPGGSWALVTRLANWAEPSQNNPRRPFRWVGYNGDPGHGEGNHLHLSWIKGAHLTGAFGDAFKEIARRLVTGPDGALKTIVQAGFDKTLKIANEYVKKAYNATFETGEPGAAAKIGDVGPGASGIFRFFKSQGFTDEQAAGWIGNLTVESGLNPAIIQPNGEGHGLVQWGGGRFAALQAFASAHGKPWQDLNTQLAFIMQELHGSESAAYRAIKGAKTVDEAVDAIGTAYERYGVRGERNAPAHAAYDKFAGKFAEGGIVPGPRGAPVPILAHAREWILNEGQVNRLASMVGTSRDALRSMMGFYGGPGGAQGGTEASADIAPLSAARVREIHDPGLRHALAQLRAITLAIGRITVHLGTVETSFAAIDKFSEQLDRVTRRITTHTTKGARNRALQGFADTMDAMLGDTGLFAQLRATIERRTATVTRRLQVLRFGQVRGRRFAGDVTERRDEVQQARADLEAQRNQREALFDERTKVRQALNDTTAQLKRKGLDPHVRQRLVVDQNKLRLALDDAEQRVADNVQSVFEAQQALLQARLDAQQKDIDEITTRFDRKAKQSDFATRIATVLGQNSVIDSLAQGDIQRTKDYAAELNTKIQGLRDIGTPEAIKAADDLADQVQDLNTQVIEMTAAALSASIDRINETATKALSRIDLRGRMLDALGAIGLDAVAGVAGLTRRGMFAERAGTLATQRAGLVGALGTAGAQGNQKAIEDLTDQIAELDVTIAENSKALFDARVADVTQRHDYTQSIDDLLLQINDLNGTITGQIDQAEKVRLLTAKGIDLELKGQELAALLAEAAPGTQAYQDLYKATLENTVAQKQNTVAVNEATGATQGPQTFSTTAWQWFREAIFSGMGQVLPQYDTSLMGGINTGAMIVPGMTSNQTVGGNVNLTINEAGGPLDVQAVTSAITFASKTAQ